MVVMIYYGAGSVQPTQLWLGIFQERPRFQDASGYASDAVDAVDAVIALTGGGELRCLPAQ